MLKIRRHRMKKGLTQEQLASMAKITQAYLSEIETGKTIPSIRVLQRIAQALSVPTREFLDDEEEDPQPAYQALLLTPL